MDSVVFRPRTFDDPLFSGDDEIHTPYILLLKNNKMQLIDMTTRKYLVDVKSSTFRSMYRAVFYRLELAEYVHMWFETGGLVTCHLPRLGLHFSINADGREIKSLEHEGFVVAERQRFDTLNNLDHGLVLQPERKPEGNNKRRKLLVPLVMEECRYKIGRRVGLDLTSCSRVFEYEIDDELRCLRSDSGSTEAWLYLAYLHACTASAMPDPFTGMTGTATAMGLLRSGRCWSCRPLNGEAQRILENIGELSPRYSYDPINMVSKLEHRPGAKVSRDSVHRRSSARWPLTRGFGCWPNSCMPTASASGSCSLSSWSRSRRLRLLGVQRQRSKKPRKEILCSIQSCRPPFCASTATARRCIAQRCC
jgi:hypothetical protein